jgi:hypothetical protein
VFLSEGGRSEAGVDGLGFEGQDTEDALVHAAKRFVADETLERFHAESELAQG